MKALLFVILLFFSVFAKTNWAVVVAGSNDWGNYRHQSDVSHMHTLLLAHGFDAAHIIDMQYDDIVDNPSNPNPGQLINKPDGPNVYPGHEAIDYKGDTVTPDNFLNVISGKKSESTPKVVESTSEDNIFIFYSDHGGPGMLSMPAGGYLYANDLIRTIKEMQTGGRFHEMTIYVEACHAGSMFADLLPPNVGVYTTTAANPHESSYAHYCGIPQYGTCLGDEYSIHFLEDCDQAQYDSWSLQQQYEKVRDQTQGSHVMQYGETKGIPNQPIKNFMAFQQFASVKANSAAQSSDRIAQGDVPMMMKWRKVLAANTKDAEATAISEFAAEMKMRQTADKRMRQFAAALGTTVEKLTKFIRVADNFDDLKLSVNIYEKICGKLNDYTLAPHAIALTNALNSGVPLAKIEQYLKDVC